jgi:hypothetical protein
MCCVIFQKTAHLIFPAVKTLNPIRDKLSCFKLFLIYSENSELILLEFNKFTVCNTGGYIDYSIQKIRMTHRNVYHFKENTVLLQFFILTQRFGSNHYTDKKIRHALCYF